MKIILTLILSLGAVALAAAAPPPDQYSVLDFGAKADGKTDDTT